MTGREKDIDWLAFCYVHDELSADETEAFEELLACNQAAREAVAQAVSLTHACKIGFQQGAAVPSLALRADVTHSLALRACNSEAPIGDLPPAAVAGRRSYSAVRWFALGAAACLVVMLSIPQSREAAVDDGAVARRPAESQPNGLQQEDALPAPKWTVAGLPVEQLVAAWFDAATLPAWHSDELDEPALDETDLAAADSFAGQQDASEGEPEFAVPAWMLEAVSASPATLSPPAGIEEI